MESIPDDGRLQELKKAIEAIISQMRKITALSGEKQKRIIRMIQMQFEFLIDDAHEVGLEKDD